MRESSYCNENDSFIHSFTHSSPAFLWNQLDIILATLSTITQFTVSNTSHDVDNDKQKRSEIANRCPESCCHLANKRTRYYKQKNWRQTEQNGVNVWCNASICMLVELRSKVRIHLLVVKTPEQSFRILKESGLLSKSKHFFLAPRPTPRQNFARICS